MMIRWALVLALALAPHVAAAATKPTPVAAEDKVHAQLRLALERAEAELAAAPSAIPFSSTLKPAAVDPRVPLLRERLDDYGEFMRQRILAAFAYSPQALVRAQQARAAIRRRCDTIFDQVDVLSTPTMPDVAPLLGVPTSTNFTGPFNILGWPALTVPVGLGPGNLPLGLQLAARPWDDATVLRVGYALEGEIGWPGLKQTAAT